MFWHDSYHSWQSLAPSAIPSHATWVRQVTRYLRRPMLIGAFVDDEPYIAADAALSTITSMLSQYLSGSASRTMKDRILQLRHNYEKNKSVAVVQVYSQSLSFASPLLFDQSYINEHDTSIDIDRSITRAASARSLEFTASLLASMLRDVAPWWIKSVIPVSITNGIDARDGGVFMTDLPPHLAFLIETVHGRTTLPVSFDFDGCAIDDALEQACGVLWAGRAQKHDVDDYNIAQRMFANISWH